MGPKCLRCAVISKLSFGLLAHLASSEDLGRIGRRQWHATSPNTIQQGAALMVKTLLMAMGRVTGWSDGIA